MEKFEYKGQLVYKVEFGFIMKSNGQKPWRAANTLEGLFGLYAFEAKTAKDAAAILKYVYSPFPR